MATHLQGAAGNGNSSVGGPRGGLEKLTDSPRQAAGPNDHQFVKLYSAQEGSRASLTTSNHRGDTDESGASAGSPAEKGAVGLEEGGQEKGKLYPKPLAASLTSVLQTSGHLTKQPPFPGPTFFSIGTV
ncbi:hypothetical protein Bbelb_237680 [Branchiostoma belcheri]|nr:hypothetical protein Bbelb_237680 [Branchiostoma belcheri]